MERHRILRHSITLKQENVCLLGFQKPHQDLEVLPWSIQNKLHHESQKFDVSVQGWKTYSWSELIFLCLIEHLRKEP